jgi:MFS transporter, DHA3 family, macrolide efflux protein
MDAMTVRRGPTDRSFFFLWQGQLVSQIGTQLCLVTLALWLKQATDSATLIGLLMMAGAVPGVILGPVGGALSDRYSRRGVLVLGDVVRGLVLLGVALVFLLAPGSVRAPVVALFVAAVVGGMVGAVWQPAATSLIPDLVPEEKLSRANSTMQASLQMGMLLAQALGGVLFTVLGTGWLALIDGLTYLYAAASDSLVRVPPRPPRPRAPDGALASLRREVLEGMRYVGARAGMRTLFCVAACMQFFLVPLAVLFPFYVDEHLLVGPQWYGFLLAASGFGMFVGYGAAGAVKVTGAATSWLLVGVLGTMSLLVAALGVVQGPWLALWIVGAIGALNGFVSVKLLTILQLATPTEVRGRVFGLLATVSGGLGPAAMGLTGAFTDLLGRNIPLMYVLCGGMTGLLSLGVLRRECRAFLAGDTGEASPAGASAPPGGLGETARSAPV